MIRKPLGLTIGAAALVLGGPLASAHVVMQKWTAYAGYQEFITVAVPHGCGASPT